MKNVMKRSLLFALLFVFVLFIGYIYIPEKNIYSYSRGDRVCIRKSCD